MNELMDVIKSRRSVRAYKSDPLKREELELIIEAAIYAPSGRNMQPWHFTVIQDREVIGRINAAAKSVLAKSDSEWKRKIGLSPTSDITYGAPALIIVSGRKDVDTSIADCSAAAQNMLLIAESMNIGSVWLGLVRACFAVPGEAERLGIPQGYEPYFGVALGYKKNEEKREAPPRNRDVVNYIIQGP